MTTDLLREAEADLATLAALPGAIRDKVKAGRDELRRLHDAVEVELARLIGGARATLASLQALQPEPTGAGGDAPPAPPPGEGAKPPLVL